MQEQLHKLKALQQQKQPQQQQQQLKMLVAAETQQ
jgi:hypothetical protein